MSDDEGEWSDPTASPEWGCWEGSRFVETTPIQDAEDLRARALFYAEGRHLLKMVNYPLLGVQALDRLSLKYYHTP